MPSIAQPPTAPPVQLGAEIRALYDSVLADRVNRAGKCVGVRIPDRWIPENEPDPRSTAARETYEAKARERCDGCPVIAECLELALRDEARSDYEPAGIFGGTAPWERFIMAGQRYYEATS
jgi:hypothetical protein